MEDGIIALRMGRRPPGADNGACGVRLQERSMGIKRGPALWSGGGREPETGAR